MKISKSKQELARIINENGGWCDGAEWAAQDRIVAFFSGAKPEYVKTDRIWCSNGDNGNYISSIESVNRVANWHQTILSREEYFFLYQNQGLEAALDEPLVIAETKPTIEQLAADYRNAKDFAGRKQEEADAAKADAEAKLAELVAAGKALGLVPVSAVKPAIDGCMQLVDMVPTRLQSHQEESVAAIGHVVNVERLYDKVRDAFDLLK